MKRAALDKATDYRATAVKLSRSRISAADWLPWRLFFYSADSEHAATFFTPTATGAGIGASSYCAPDLLAMNCIALHDFRFATAVKRERHLFTRIVAAFL